MAKIDIYGGAMRETRGGPDPWGEIDSAALQSGIREIIQALSPSFFEAGSNDEGLNVQEVEVEIAVSVTGKVGLFGSGVEAEGAAKIKVKLGR